MTIDTGRQKPTNIAPYRIPVRWRAKLEDEVQALLKLDIIQPSRSPYAAPVVCVAKPDGSLRMCIDYRELNKTIVTDAYPMPRIEELIDKVAPVAFISTVELAKGYYQVPLAEDIQHKTAFITPQGKFKFKWMPFRLKNAPAVFQRLMQTILQDLPYASAYLDDVVVYSHTWKEHLQHLGEVFRHLSDAGLTLKLKKCAFGRAQVSFLGHILGRGTVQPQEMKVEALKMYKKPKTKRDLRAFLGLIGY